MDQPLYELLRRAQGLNDWYSIDNHLQSCEDDKITKTDIQFLLRQCSSSSPKQIDNELSLVQLRIIHSMIEKHSSIVDRNLMLSLFQAGSNNTSIPKEIIYSLLEFYEEKSSIDVFVKRDKHWKGKFLCDACFGYCPVNVNSIKIFIEKYPECLRYSTNSNQKLLPIHKACQFKFRRRAKRENSRDSQSLFQLLLHETIRTGVFKKSDQSMGGLFKSDENNVDGLGFLVQNVGKNTAWDWILHGLANLDGLPILQAIIQNVKRKDATLPLRKTIQFFGSKVAKVRDDQGNLPLHVAISKSTDWDDGLSDIIAAFPGALEENFNSTGLSPFASIILAKDEFELCTLYSVILFHPAVLKQL